MKTLLLIIFPFLLSAQTDKVMHYYSGMGISVLMGEIALQIKDNNAIALSTGVLMGSCAGIAKEQYDRYKGRQFDNMDALTTAWGALNGAILLRVVIDIREKKRYKNQQYDQELL